MFAKVTRVSATLQMLAKVTRSATRMLARVTRECDYEDVCEADACESDQGE